MMNEGYNSHEMNDETSEIHFQNRRTKFENLLLRFGNEFLKFRCFSFLKETQVIIARDPTNICQQCRRELTRCFFKCGLRISRSTPFLSFPNNWHGESSNLFLVCNHSQNQCLTFHHSAANRLISFKPKCFTPKKSLSILFFVSSLLPFI